MATRTYVVLACTILARLVFRRFVVRLVQLRLAAEKAGKPEVRLRLLRNVVMVHNCLVCYIC